MSRTHKDRPWRLGGDRHKWFCTDNHGQHGRFTKIMSRLARRELDREFRDDPDCAPKKSKWWHMYFD